MITIYSESRRHISHHICLQANHLCYPSVISAIINVFAFLSFFPHELNPPQRQTVQTVHVSILCRWNVAKHTHAIYMFRFCVNFKIPSKLVSVFCVCPRHKTIGIMLRHARIMFCHATRINVAHFVYSCYCWYDPAGSPF